MPNQPLDKVYRQVIKECLCEETYCFLAVADCIPSDLEDGHEAFVLPHR